MPDPAENLAGRTYGPIAYRVGIEKAREFARATGESLPGEALPGEGGPVSPAFQAAIAHLPLEDLLAEPSMANRLARLVHSDETVEWPAPVLTGETVATTAAVTRARTRFGSLFLTLAAETVDTAGKVLTRATTGLVVGGSPEPSSQQGGPAEATSPAPHAGADESSQGQSEAAPDQTKTSPDQASPAAPEPGTIFTKHVAERSDLVRFAGASLDFNPIHWDPAAARSAGFDDVVVHGMLTLAWAATDIAADLGQEARLTALNLRFRAPLYAGEEASITLGPTDGNEIRVAIGGRDGKLVATGAANYSTRT